MQQQITRGDYLKDLITIYIENNLQQELNQLYSQFVFQCGEIQKFLTPAQVIKISFTEQESQLLTNYNTCYLAGITTDGHKETFNGSLSFNTRGEVVYYEPTPNGSVSADTTSSDCPCTGIRGFFANCTQPAIKAYFSLNYAPTKLSELINDADFQDGVDVAESISIHNSSTEAHQYIQGLISDEASTRASQTEALEVSIGFEASVRASETEALLGSIQAETTARQQAVSAAITTTEGYADTAVSNHNSSNGAHPYIQSALASTTEAIRTDMGSLSSLTTTATSSLVNAINSEVSDRKSADNGLQNQIDAIVASSDVTDIVGTYADLQAYDTSHLGDNDIIKVLSDSMHSGAPSYYRYKTSTQSFTYIGSEAETYTKSESNSIFVTKTTKINNKALSSDITLSASDVSALPSTTTITNLASTTQMAAINSGVTTTVVAQVTTNKNDISTINGKIPSGASSSNKLATASDVSAKQNTITGGASSITSSNLTTNRALLSDGNGKVAVSTVSATELGYLGGASSNIQNQLNSKQNIDDEVYDFFIDPTESNPANAVTYAGVNTSYTPASMNYTSGQFNYGSWSNAFFLKLFKPCMLKSNGTVDYYLNPDDYAYKDDKVTASDVSDTNYDGNAMVEIGQIWISEENTANNKIHIRIANSQITPDFECITHRKKDGTLTPHIYRSLFDGCTVGTKIRSIKGQTVNKNTTGDNQLTYAQNNGTGWNIDEYSVRRLIQYLLILMGKSLNTQSVFGQGVTSGAEAGQVATGTLSNKGMFWGASGTTSAVKVFHMENLWGNTWKLTNGLILAGGKLKYKMCEGTYDGSTTDDYNKTGNGYIDSGITPGGTSGGFISEVTLIPGIGLVPKTMSGTDSTYYCDGCWFNTGQTGFARFGGGSGNGSKCGAFYCDVSNVVGHSSWHFGVALSYKKSS